MEAPEPGLGSGGFFRYKQAIRYEIMSRYVEPTISTVIKNPTNRDLKYSWIGANGMFVGAGKSIVIPYCVFTAGTPTQRSAMGEALRAKMAVISYRSRLPIEKVKSIKSTITHEASAKKAAPKKEAPKKEEKPPREDIIVPTGEGKDAVEDSKDLVQKFTGQETTTMRDAMGWEQPPTDDPRTGQEAETVTMADAMKEGVGSPEEKAAEAATKEKAAKKTAAEKPAANKAVDPKKSAAAKKAAATREANAAKKAAAAKKK
jgi:hypothetical protein